VPALFADLFQRAGHGKAASSIRDQDVNHSECLLDLMPRSKRGIVQGLMERAAFSSGYAELVREAMRSDDPETRVRYAAKIARRIFDSLRSESEVLRGATAVAPDFVREKERLRYERQAGLIKLLEEKSALWPELSAAAARDILWTLTSYEIHRCLVVERKWSADRYEKWLGDTLVRALLKPK